MSKRHLDILELADIRYRMTTFELLALAMLLSLTLIFLLFIVDVDRKMLLAIFLNVVSASLIYFILLTFDVVPHDRVHALGVGLTGILYLVAMIFV